MLLFRRLLALLALNSIDGYSQELNIGALFGAQDEFAWMSDVFKCTISAINNHSDGWYDDLLKDTVIEFQIADPNCDDQSSIHAFYDIKRAWNESINAIIGPRRSGGVIASGWLTTEEQIVQATPTASATELSDKDKFPFMTQLVAPGDERGEVGAMVAMLEGFGWSRVSILHTDSEYATNYVKEFLSLWEGRGKLIVSSQLIKLNGGSNCMDSVDEISAITAFNKIPTNKPSINSRVVLLVAYNEEASTILKIAQEISFQSDTIWVGPVTWIGREIISDSNFEMPQIPGYIGLTPYTNRSPTYYDYWKVYQKWQSKKATVAELPDFASEYLVDSIIAVLLAFNVTSPQDWKNASKITEVLEKQSFNGVSGLVELKNGYRTNPKYSIVILNVSDGNPEWKQIGSVGTNITSFKVDASKYICFAGSGCTTGNAFPSDIYPTPFEFCHCCGCPPNCKLLLVQKSSKSSENDRYSDKNGRIAKSE
jgi:ABC-type branched-subunit amino acid transport system substrate-binding protein